MTKVGTMANPTMDRFFAAGSAGMIAYMAAIQAGLPSWRHLPIGDATDYGVLTAMVVWFGIRAIAAQAIPTQRAETPKSGSVHG